METTKIFELVGVGAVVISLAFVGYELRMTREVAQNESFGTSIEATIELANLISSHPSAWRKGCLGEELSEDEVVVFGTLVKAVDRFNFFRYLRAITGITNAAPEVFIGNIAKARILSPGYNAKWLQMAEYVASDNEWYTLVEEAYTILKSDSSILESDSASCGIYAF